MRSFEVSQSVPVYMPVHGGRLTEQFYIRTRPLGGKSHDGIWLAECRMGAGPSPKTPQQHFENKFRFLREWEENLISVPSITRAWLFSPCFIESSDKSDFIPGSRRVSCCQVALLKVSVTQGFFFSPVATLSCQRHRRGPLGSLRSLQQRAWGSALRVNTEKRC